MPNRDFDAMAKAEFEPITCTIEGVEYTVGKVGAQVMETLSKPREGEPLTSVCETLALLLGAKPDTFVKTDIRVVMAALQFIADEITKQFNTPAVNPSEAEAR